LTENRPFSLFSLGIFQQARQLSSRFRPAGRNPQEGKAKKQKKNRPFWQRLLRGVGIFFLVFVGYFLAVDFNLLWLFGRSPGMAELRHPKVAIASEIYTEDSVLIGRYFNENRTPVPFDSISPILIKALVATEDERFYHHNGIDLRAIGAVIAGQMGRGEKRGGSTITQQLAKNLFKTRTDGSKGLLGGLPFLGTAIAKTKEWITALKLENNFSKPEILTMYLNTVDFGANSFGIKAAARTFFGTTPDSLKAEESATLVGLLKAPTNYSPLSNPKKSIERRNLVLRQLQKFGGINQQQFDSISELPMETHFTVEKPYDGPATYFRGALNNFLKSWCKENGHDLYSDGLKIYTTINSTLQRYAEEAMQEHMSSLQRRFNTHWQGQNPWVDDDNHEIPGFIEMVSKRTEAYKAFAAHLNNNPVAISAAMNTPRKMSLLLWKGNKLMEVPETLLSPLDSIRHYKHFLHAGFVVEDPYNGHIKAWVGGINYKYFQYDHVQQGKRQPGSTFKPFVYTAAIANGFGPCDRIRDVPITINYTEKGEEKSWSPHNATYSFSGANMTLRHAMARSINVAAAQLTAWVGWDSVVAFAHRCGIRSKLQRVPSIGLGSSEVSVFELTGAYATFLNKGVHIEPNFISKVTDHEGKVLLTVKPKQWRAIDEETAWLMVHMLKGGVEEPGGTTNALFEYPGLGFNKNDLGGKTGTTSNHSDGWFVGVCKDLVAGSWVGGEDRSIHFRTSETGEGSKTALPIFGKFMEKVYADPSLGITYGRFPKPGVPITKDYYCPTKWTPVRTKSDSISPEGGEESAPTEEGTDPPPAGG